MPKLKRVSAKEAIRVFEKLGFKQVRQKGSHIVLKKETFGKVTGCVIPNHKALAIGTLRGILKQANISPKEFIHNL